MFIMFEDDITIGLLASIFEKSYNLIQIYLNSVKNSMFPHKKKFNIDRYKSSHLVKANK